MCTENNKLAIKKLIFSYPLIKSVNDSRTVKVLAAGYDEYTKAFIDECLTAVQIPDLSLRLTAVSELPRESCDDYIRGRAALKDFADINGSLEKSGKESFGKIDFVSADSFAAEPQKIAEYTYIFVSGGSDEDNIKNAQELASYASDKCTICFVAQNAGEQAGGNLIPVFVNADECAEADDGLMEMALNTHLIWNNKISIDEALELFNSCEYEKNSSLSYALSVKYKLLSVGINYDSPDAAGKFAQLLKENNGLLGTLSACEHRRWVTEKLLDGWTQPLCADGTIDYDGIIESGAVRNEKNKTHICITRCSNDMTSLSRLSAEEWDNDNNNAMTGRDDLDKVSLTLHRAFRKHSQGMSYSPETELQSIYELFIKNDISLTAYNQLVLCLKNILNGCYGYSVHYDYYEKAVKDAAEPICEAERSSVNSELDKIRHKYYSKIQANLYKNYKLNNVDLIEKIPFVLTYKVKPGMAMALDLCGENQEKNDAVFENAASVTVIKPSVLVYTYYFSANSKTGQIADKLCSLVNYFNSRRIGCKVRLVVAVSSTVPEKKLNGLKKRADSLIKNKVIEKYELIPCRDEGDAAEKLVVALANENIDMYDGTTLLFSSPVCNLDYIGRIRSTFSYFEFKSEAKEFVNCSGCDYLKYIDDNSYFRIMDMFSLKRAEDAKFNTPDYSEDYEKLWEIYCGSYFRGHDSFRRGVCTWNILCDALSEYTARNDKVISARLSPCRRYEDTLYFPSYSKDAAFVILERLEAHNVVEAGSCISTYTEDTCRMKIISSFRDISGMIEEFINNANVTANYRNIYVETFNNRIDLYSGRLDVPALELNFNNRRDIMELLRQLSGARYISRLTENGNTVSFSFTSQRMKEMLTSAGMILEVYTYYEALKTGYFDDIASGYEFRWSHDNVKNELDGVMTKGFRSLIIECKARKQLDQNFYHKLYSISEQFGINAGMVLIANTYDSFFANQNHDQIQRGQMMDIITVSKREDIENIGETLKKIMEDKFIM